MASIIRDRTPIASLDDPKRSIPVGEQDIRLDDYLNDKIQTLTDFDDLDALLANVDVQRIQLQDQVMRSSQVFIHFPLAQTRFKNIYENSAKARSASECQIRTRKGERCGWYADRFVTSANPSLSDPAGKHP